MRTSLQLADLALVMRMSFNISSAEAGKVSAISLRSKNCS